MKLIKMQGLGNDYLYFHEEVPPDVETLAVKLSDRHFGIGSDGLIYICRSEIADFRMRIFNADGSEAKMCGNGIRCVGKFVYEKGLTEKTVLDIETGSGIRRLKLSVDEGRVREVTVDMGKVTVSDPMSISVQDELYTLTPVSVGNPHAVIFTDEAGLKLPERIGRFVEYHPMFPDGVNTEFVSVRSESEIRMRVYERGSGVTMACGTGACASAAAAVKQGYCRRDLPVRVILDGGVLEITVLPDDTVLMKGPCEFVYEAETDWKGEL